MGPPPEVVAELIAFYNDSTTTRMQGDVTFPSDSRFEGRLALHRGTLRIAGQVEGPIAVANGTLHLLPGADVRGDILVIGGRLIRAAGARHQGRQRVYWDAAPVEMGEEGLLELRERRRPIGDLAAARTSFQTGKVRTTLLLATGGTYNRIEGLPIVFGPTFDLRTGRRSAFRLDLRGILRTAGSDTRLAGLRLPGSRRVPAGTGSASPAGSTASWYRSRTSRCRRARWAGPPSSCSATTATTSTAAAMADRSGSRRPVRFGWRSRAGGTRSARCGPPIRGRCSATATAGAATR